MNLKKLVNDYSDVLKDKRKLKGLINDYFVEEPIKRNIFMIIIEENIVEELLREKNISGTTYMRYVRKLTDEYGIGRNVADSAIREWCDALEIAFNQESIQKNVDVVKQDKISKDKNFKELDDIFNSIMWFLIGKEIYGI